jgi:hypothetical protein
MTNEKVIRNWINNRKGKSLNMSTDGKSLFSYRMKIGETVHETNGLWSANKKHGLNVQKPYFYSQTTSKHVGIVKRYADKMVNPKPIQKGFYTWYLFP